MFRIIFHDNANENIGGGFHISLKTPFETRFAYTNIHTHTPKNLHKKLQTSVLDIQQHLLKV